MSAVLQRAQRRTALTRHEVPALLCLTAGLLLGPAAAFVGLFLVLRSNRWSLPWKLLAFALPAALVCVDRMPPASFDFTSSTGIAIVLGLAWAIWMLVRSARRAFAPAGRVSVIAALVLAAVMTSLGWVGAQHVHQIGTYDLSPELIAASHAAERRGEGYGVVTRAWLKNGSPTRGQIEGLAGPGNDQFDTVWDDLAAHQDGPAGQPTNPKDLCIVFPVVRSLQTEIERVRFIARLCYANAITVEVHRLSNR